ncbi:hypothetical protein X777_05354 [Ooceraea biroi]|uniref:BEN domain-containing protein n=1 Tax=Ooceraea biroi TaxID=2015173 RepID=A0A026WJ44_OOCBI|nr:hypothetical protein X777_05354 [Ooceraea biroi]
MDSQIKFASVRYYDNERKKIHIVPIEKIQNFEVLDKYEDPYFVERLNTVSMEEKKLRYSDAVQKIFDKDNAEPNETHNKTVIFHSRYYNKYEDIINKKLRTVNRDSPVVEKKDEKLFESALQKQIQYFKHENEELKLENRNLRSDIFLLKEELHTLKTKKQLFPEEQKRSASPTTSTPKRMRGEITVNVENTLFECRKIKKKGSDLDYDSDQYLGLTNKENMSAWYDEVNGRTIKMMHLKYGISIPYMTWKEIRKLKRPSLFVRQLSRALWGVDKLMNRAVVVERSKDRLPNRSPRKPLTPAKRLF